jgi:SAM-dependent methyltransferase
MSRILHSLLQKDLRRYGFNDLMYKDERLFKGSIKTNFAGWYNPLVIPAQVKFIIRACKLPPRARVLDAACGHGRHAMQFRKRGCQVTGTDISKTLVRYLTRTYPAIRFQRVALADMKFKAEFDLAVVLGNSLSLMPKTAGQKALVKLAGALSHKGKLFLELDNKQRCVSSGAVTKDWNLYHNRWLVMAECYYDRKRQLEISRDICFDFKTRSPWEECVGVKRLYDSNEISAMLRRAGFKLCARYGDWNGVAFNKKSPALLLVAEKTGPRPQC